MTDQPDAPITITDVIEAPDRLTTTLVLPDDQSVTFRLLRADDGVLLGQYFNGLSDETRQRFGPHPLDQATANQLCATLNYAETLPFVVVDHDQIIAYIILLPGLKDFDAVRFEQAGYPLAADKDCTIAPSVADAYQNRGLGKCATRQAITVAKRLDRRWLILLGGTQASNARAVHFYHKLGFETISTFEYPVGVLNYNMRLGLAD
jgi:ribosomal protein S18 acetylase RimI-like enzyme